MMETISRVWNILIGLSLFFLGLLSVAAMYKLKVTISGHKRDWLFFFIILVDIAYLAFFLIVYIKLVSLI